MIDRSNMLDKITEMMDREEVVIEPELPREPLGDSSSPGSSSSGESSDLSDDQDLTYHVFNRVELLRRMIKVLTPKRLTKLAPACLKNKPMPEIKAALMEELMRLSDKRLMQVLHGEVGADSSSDTEFEHIHNEASQGVDGGVISLDDITDDENIDLVIQDKGVVVKEEIPTSESRKRHKTKRTNKKKIKTEKPDTDMDEAAVDAESSSESETEVKKDPAVMNALNLLELQARARAIRSQLRSELGEPTSAQPSESTSANHKNPPDGTDVEMSPNSVVCISPARDVIVLDENTDLDTDIDDEPAERTDEPSINNETNVEKPKSKAVKLKRDRLNTEIKRVDDSITNGDMEMNVGDIKDEYKSIPVKETGKDACPDDSDSSDVIIICNEKDIDLDM